LVTFVIDALFFVETGGFHKGISVMQNKNLIMKGRIGILKRLTAKVLILLFLFLLSGCAAKTSSSEDSSVSVKVEQVAKSEFNMDYNVSGKIEASNKAIVAPKVSGRVTEVDTKLGDRVKKGQILFQIESKGARNQLTQAEASLGIAKVNFNTAEQALMDAQSNYDRYSSLYDSKLVSKSEFEQATTKLVNAKLSLEQAQLQINQSEATLSISQDNYNDYSVTAPIDGLIGEINVENGVMVGNQTDAAVIVNIDTVKVDASVPESIVNSIRLGSKVTVTIDSLHKSVTGKLNNISPKADVTTMGYPAEMVLDNQTGEIKPGMAVKVNLYTGTMQNIIALPLDAVTEQDGQHNVYIVENNKAKEVAVVTGVSNDTRVEICKGLEEGDSIIISGNRLISNGQKVKVVTQQDGDSK